MDGGDPGGGGVGRGGGRGAGGPRAGSVGGAGGCRGSGVGGGVGGGVGADVRGRELGVVAGAPGRRGRVGGGCGFAGREGAEGQGEGAAEIGGDDGEGRVWVAAVLGDVGPDGPVPVGPADARGVFLVRGEFGERGVQHEAFVGIVHRAEGTRPRREDPPYGDAVRVQREQGAAAERDELHDAGERSGERGDGRGGRRDLHRLRERGELDGGDEGADGVHDEVGECGEGAQSGSEHRAAERGLVRGLRRGVVREAGHHVHHHGLRLLLQRGEQAGAGGAADAEQPVGGAVVRRLFCAVLSREDDECVALVPGGAVLRAEVEGGEHGAGGEQPGECLFEQSGAVDVRVVGVDVRAEVEQRRERAVFHVHGQRGGGLAVFLRRRGESGAEVRLRQFEGARGRGDMGAEPRAGDGEVLESAVREVRAGGGRGRRRVDGRRDGGGRERDGGVEFLGGGGVGVADVQLFGDDERGGGGVGAERGAGVSVGDVRDGDGGSVAGRAGVVRGDARGEGDGGDAGGADGAGGGEQQSGGAQGGGVLQRERGKQLDEGGDGVGDGVHQPGHAERFAPERGRRGERGEVQAAG